MVGGAVFWVLLEMGSERETRLQQVFCCRAGDETGELVWKES